MAEFATRRWWGSVSLGSLPLPRVWALLSPGGDAGPTTLAVGAELSDHNGDPVFALACEIPWHRPRPWECDLTFPSKHGVHDRAWRWREHAREAGKRASR